jgi:outer membrane protein OmpA-like peptidoglycan-associated protein
MQYSQAMSFGLAAGRGLTAGVGEPEWRGVLSFAYTPGAPKLDPFYVAPPPEIIDPNTNDADYDKLVDAKDKCPKEGEDKDGFEDDDGCPDLDNDKDNVVDTKDKCPVSPEDLDGFADDDGCPDPDNDKDGVSDGVDKCPDKPEKINGNDDSDGCPDNGDSLVISNPDRLELLEPVLFKDDAIDKESLNQLNQLASTLRARADIKRIRIGVHVQPTKAAKKDQALSERRATAIREYLTKRGIEEKRLDVKAFGGATPLVKPETKGAAMINDRIELIILERN